MLGHKPEQLTEEQQEHYARLWHSMFTVVVRAIKVTLGLAGLFLTYLLFGSAMQDMFTPPQVVSAEEQLRRQKARGDDEVEIDYDKIENGIHLATGLKVADNWETVRATCTACHSAALVTQNRATREGWKEMITWMQQTQGLWELGASEKGILDYLAANYAPEEEGRRPNLDLESVEWYILEL